MRESQADANLATNVGQHGVVSESHEKTPRFLKTISRSNKVLEALSLPTICNMNPRSVYYKVDEFHQFVENEEVDMIFLSELWERENYTLEDIIHLENHEVISNVYQRKGTGGRPAIIVNKNKFHIQDLTNTLIPVMWGVEAVWCLLTPKQVNQASKIQKIACAAIYSRPGSRHKTDLLDHISDAFNILNSKFGRGLHFIIAGDTNELRLQPILDLSPNLVQIVTKSTRIDKASQKEAMLDPIMMTISQYYRQPEILAPLDPDPDKTGKPSDHKIVLCKPISTINNITARTTRENRFRPISQSGLDKMKLWLMGEEWETVYNEKNADAKAEVFQKLITNEFYKCFPEKSLKIANDDQPWITQKLKTLDRQRKRCYHKNRRSTK